MTTKTQTPLDLPKLRARVAAIVAEFDQPLPEGDDGLEEAVRRLDRVRTSVRAIYGEFAIDHLTEEAEISPNTDSIDFRLWDVLVERKPQTLAGVIVKLRWALADNGRPLGHSEDSDAVRLVAGLLPAVERAAARSGEYGVSALDPFALGGDRPDEDAALIALFREWRAQLDALYVRLAGDDFDENSDAEHEFDEALDAAYRRIFDEPARGIVGFAIKAFMLAREVRDCIHNDGDHLSLGTFELSDYAGDCLIRLDQHALLGLVRDVVRFVPSLEPHCRRLLAAPTKLP